MKSSDNSPGRLRVLQRFWNISQWVRWMTSGDQARSNGLQNFSSLSHYQLE